MKEADEIFVLDTGSTDNTVKLLKDLGVCVKTKSIKPWRFDVARNKSLEMIPNNYDICVCTDLDEVFEKNWRSKLEKAWKKNTNRMRYVYNWSLDSNKKPVISFMGEKIHSRHNYKWIHPVHEILSYSLSQENFETSMDIVLNHFPDNKKSRGSYLPLLELSVKEDPTNDRNMHYLGREYMYYGKWNEAIDTLIKHLSLKNSTWKDERCASMRFISRCYIALNRYDEARMWLEKAINEAPYLRDPYVEMALLEYKKEKFSEVEFYCLKALEIKSHQRTYINETFSWDYTIYDLLSIAYFYKNDLKKSLININKALDFDKKNVRLISNKLLIMKAMKRKD